MDLYSQDARISFISFLYSVCPDRCEVTDVKQTMPTSLHIIVFFTIRDHDPVRFATCKITKVIRTFHRFRVFCVVSPCRLVDGYLTVCCGDLPPHTI